MRLARKITREAYTLLAQAARYTRARPEPGARQAQRLEARQMLADARKIEDQLVERLVRTAPIVCATTTGLDGRRLGGRFFDWCVLDEASQGTEPGAWIPLQYANRLVLAGDPFQLPPTILSAQAIAGGLQISLMERLMVQLGPTVARRLAVQYRMNQEIMSFSPGQMAVISPYSAKVRLLRERLGQPEIEIDSVDGFQGREKEAILLSLV